MSNLRSGRHFGFLSPALAAAIGLLLTASRSALAEEVLVFRDVRIFDGTKVIPSATVVVRDGRTATVIVRDDRVARPEPEVTVPADAKIVEGKGKTLIPGLIDCHTHTFAPNSSSRRSSSA